VREKWESGYDRDTDNIRVVVQELNYTQCQILDRFAAGEPKIKYHPQSVLGGEVGPMQSMGLADVVADEQGFTYLVPAE